MQKLVIKASAKAAQAASQRAAELSEAIKAGKPTPPPEAAVRLPEAACVADATSQLTTARNAAAALTVERERIERELKLAEDKVGELAAAVISAEAILEAAELHQAWNELWFRFDRLNAITGIPGGAVRLPPDALRLLRTIGGFDQRQWPGNRNPIAVVLREAWQHWSLNLTHDSEAMFGPELKQFNPATENTRETTAAN
jgi:hypothetical protein